MTNPSEPPAPIPTPPPTPEPGKPAAGEVGAPRDTVERVLARTRALRASLEKDQAPTTALPLYVAEFVELVAGGSKGVADSTALSLDEFGLPAGVDQSRAVDADFLMAKLTALEFYLDGVRSRADQQESYLGVWPTLDVLAGLDAAGKQVPQHPSTEDEAAWREIAQEVARRKKLLMASAHELRSRNIENPLTLATVDVFVEKAQKELEDRAVLYRNWGMGTAVAALILMLGALVWLVLPSLEHWRLSVPLEPPTLGPDLRTDWGGVILLVFKNSTIAALAVGAIVYLAFLSRALLHEMVVLYQRRHALRFGRLVVYLHPENLSVAELVSAFNWNTDYRSAFKDIRPEKMVQLPTGKTAEIASQAVGTIGDVVKQVGGDRNS